MNAGDRAWSGVMIDDVIDAVRWAVREQFAHPNRIAVMGTGFGGYAALMALERTPELFACGIAIGAPTDLRSMLMSLPPIESARHPMYDLRVSRADDVEFLSASSPFAGIEKLKKPVFMAHGANDVRASIVDAERFASNLRQQGTSVTFLRVDGEGHNFARTASRLALYRGAEEFLAEHLGGRIEGRAASADQSETANLGE